MSLEGASQPHCFLIEPSRQANSAIIKTIDQKTSVRTQKSSNSPGKCYKPISYPLIYNAASLGIDCFLRSASFVFCRMVDVISVIFIELGSIFRFMLAFINMMDTFHTLDTRSLCLPFERDCYLSQTAAYVG